MPAAFNKCVKQGGRVRTKSMSGGKYLHLCFKNGRSFAGYVKKRKGK